MRHGLILVLTAFVLLGSGCGLSAAQATDVTSVRFDKEGGITHTIVEPFDTEAYDIDELRDMIEADIVETELPEGAIAVSRISAEDGNVTVLMTYADAETFESFNDEVLFFGTVAEAEEAGYAMRNGNFVNAADADGSTMGAFDDTEKTVIVTSMKIQIDTPAKVGFMTDGAVLKSDTEVDAAGVEKELVYLILDK